MKIGAIIGLIVVQYALFILTANAKLKISENKNPRDKLLQTNDIYHANHGHQDSSSDKRPASSSENQLSPIILLPGDGGSRLQAKLNRQDVLHKYCERKSSDWFDLWLNLSLLVPFALECWVDK